MMNGWRWFGPADAVTLVDIRQAEVTDIVTALYHVRCGSLWTKEDILARQAEVEAAGMRWSVVESLPIHESIKTRTGDWQKHVEIYIQSLRNLAECGIKTICCNFMPILDWTRSTAAMPLPDGSSVLFCDMDKVCAYDCFALKRPQAEKDYSAEEIARAKNVWDGLSEAERDEVGRTILMGLPGTVDDLSREEFLAALQTYAAIDDAKLREHFYGFLNTIRPVCDELGVRIAIHPDDPPRPIFGLPRIVSTASDIERLYREVPSENIGMTFCAGSLGGRQDNDTADMFERFIHRIHFVHLRNTTFVTEKSFHESANHLEGHTDMARILKAIAAEEKRRGEGIVVRPDHGKQMAIDAHRTCYAGYSYAGRMKGLAELRGMNAGLLYGHKPFSGKVAVITGGAGVLCSVMTEDLLRAGAKVAVLDLRAEVAEAFCAEMRNKGFRYVMPVAANVLDRDSLVAAKKSVLDAWGKIDILINGAGGNHPKGTCAAEQMTAETPLSETFFGMEIEGFEFVNRLNFVGTLLPCQVFAEAMLSQGGSIVNISSMAATQPMTKVAAYAAAKAAIDNFTRWLATHLAPMNIRVNAIAPGFFITNQNRFLMLEKDEKTLTPRGNKVIAKTPMRKFGKPEDLCGAVRFLIDDSSNFVTGVVIPVDGGFLAYSGV